MADTPEASTPHQAPRLWAWIALPLLLLGLLYGAYWFITSQVVQLVTPARQEAPPLSTAPVEDIKPRDWTRYGDTTETPATPPSIPVAQPLRKDLAAQDSAQMQSLMNAVVAQGTMVERLLNAMSTMQTTQQTQPNQTAVKQASVATTAPKETTQPRKATPIKFLIDNTTTAPETKKEDDEKQKDSLLEPAHHVRPLDPAKVLYRAQVLPGRLLTSINSDIPGSVHVELTIPIYSKQAKNDDKPLLDKGTVIICSYKGEIKFGQTRIPLTIEEAQPPNGDIIELKAIGGDEEGRSGVTGTVNNHYGKLALATGINAVLQLGVKSLAGTPGQGQYFQNPVQQAAQDAGSSAAQDIGSVVKQQLKVPPTIEKDKNKDPFVTILLEKNLSFYRSPKIVK